MVNNTPPVWYTGSNSMKTRLDITMFLTNSRLVAVIVATVLIPFTVAVVMIMQIPAIVSYIKMMMGSAARSEINGYKKYIKQCRGKK